MNPFTFRIAAVAFVLGALSLAATWDGPTDDVIAADSQLNLQDALIAAQLNAKESK